MSKKKVCFISLGNLYLCPYISKYTSLIDGDYDVIYWNRHGIEESIGSKQTYSFNYKMDEGIGKFNKALGYLRFKKYAQNIIKKIDYDVIVLLQTSVGILLESILLKKYKGKYIVDIRDYTMEKNPVFFAYEKILIKNCAYAVISSKGYEEFLPKFNYVLVHNDLEIDHAKIKEFEERHRNSYKIVISYIGLIRFHDQNKRMILKFKNDSRFKLRFIGKDAYALKAFCKENHVNNVELIDRFPPAKTLDYYYETDIIYNLYGNNTPLLDYALSNKLYYAAKLKIPILVCPNTYMEKISMQYGFGFSFDLNDLEAVNKLVDYYRKIEWELFYNNCNSFVRKVKDENKVFEDIMKVYLNDIQS